MGAGTQYTTVIFTDLDGCLLNHDDYDWTAAAATLKTLESLEIPVVFASSKTQAEMLALRLQIGNAHPFIVENGGAVCVPDVAASPGREVGPDTPTRTVPLVDGRDEVLAALMPLKTRFQFQGFADLGIEGVMRTTGLTRDGAKHASQRHCTEPVHWNDSESLIPEFSRLLEARGFTVVQGGRFLHVSRPTDKANGVRWLLDHYRQRGMMVNRVIAVGDSPIDAGMLELADIAVVQPNPDGVFRITPNTDTVIKAPRSGADGWAHAIKEALSLQ